MVERDYQFIRVNEQRMFDVVFELKLTSLFEAEEFDTLPRNVRTAFKFIKIRDTRF